MRPWRWVERTSFQSETQPFAPNSRLRVMSASMIAGQLFQDVRYALRTMAANPLFASMAVLSLALGIGANTPLYTFLDSILMRSLPLPHPDSPAMLNLPSKHPPPVPH